MEVKQLVIMINAELKKNNKITVNKIYDKLGIKKSTGKSILRRGGYTYNADLRQYEKEVGQEVGQEVGRQEKPVVIDVGHIKDNVGQYEKEITSLMENYNILMEMINQYKNNNNYTPGGIEVRLPVEENGQFKASLRINKTVLEDFKVFCQEHKQFTQKELLSMALIEYMEKYK